MAAEFERQDADEAIATMTQSPTLTHVAVATGATGREALHNFYANKFCPFLPPDAELQLLTRIGQNRIVDEFVLRFTTPRRHETSMAARNSHAFARV